MVVISAIVIRDVAIRNTSNRKAFDAVIVELSEARYETALGLLFRLSFGAK